jgi:hypothetical protein
MITPTNKHKNDYVSMSDGKGPQKKTYRIKSGYKKKQSSPPKSVFRQNGERIIEGKDKISKNNHVVNPVRISSRKKSVNSKQAPSNYNNHQKKYHLPPQQVSNK